MILAIASWLAGLRDWAIALTALAVVFKLPFVNRPIRWVLHQLVGEPVSDFLKHVLDQHAEPDRARMTLVEQRLIGVEHEVRTNQGESLRDVADRTEQLAIVIAERLGP